MVEEVKNNWLFKHNQRFCHKKVCIGNKILKVKMFFCEKMRFLWGVNFEFKTGHAILSLITQPSWLKNEDLNFEGYIATYKYVYEVARGKIGN